MPFNAGSSLAATAGRGARRRDAAMPANTPRLEHSADIAVVVVVVVAVAVASKRVVVVVAVGVKPCTPTWQVKNNQRKEREIITL